jgi:hypothetical protein
MLQSLIFSPLVTIKTAGYQKRWTATVENRLESESK